VKETERCPPQKIQEPLRHPAPTADPRRILSENPARAWAPQALSLPQALSVRVWAPQAALSVRCLPLDDAPPQALLAMWRCLVGAEEKPSWCRLAALTRQ
jgi:hypothetical protein